MATRIWLRLMVALLAVCVIMVYLTSFQSEWVVSLSNQEAEMMNDFFSGTPRSKTNDKVEEDMGASDKQEVGSSGSVGDALPEFSEQHCFDMVKFCNRRGPKNEELPSVDKSLVPSNPTLALGSPVLKGGYRNQYMRFVALVGHAMSNNFSLLLPSIKWHEKDSRFVVPFQTLFDVDHWNSNSTTLPKLVPYEQQQHPQWNPTTTTFIGACPTVVQWFSSPHRTSMYRPIRDSNAPYVFGGARSGQEGNLWDYFRAREKFSKDIDLPGGKKISLRSLEAEIAKALAPSHIVKSILKALEPKQRYIALHPRVEPEMLHHAHCQDEKIRELSKILAFVRKHPDFAHLDSMFVAVAMPQMKEKQNQKWQFADLHATNLQLLENILSDGLERTKGDPSSRIHAWTAGEGALEKLKIPTCMLTIMASVINMEIAIEADVFVGTTVSTWSNSVWKIRHYLGRPNYVISHYGIKRLEGLPPPFNC